MSYHVTCITATMMSRPIQEKRSIQKKTSIAGVSTSYNWIGTSLALLRVLSGVMQRIKHCCFNRYWCEFSIEPYLLDSRNTSLCSHTSNSHVLRLENYWVFHRTSSFKFIKFTSVLMRPILGSWMKFVILWLSVIILIEKCFICSQIDSLKRTQILLLHQN